MAPKKNYLAPAPPNRPQTPSQPLAPPAPTRPGDLLGTFSKKPSLPASRHLGLLLPLPQAKKKNTYPKRPPSSLGPAEISRSPKCRFEGTDPPPPCALGTLPHASLGHPFPEHQQSERVGRGWGRVLREGLGLEGRVLQLHGGEGGDPPKGSWGQTHIWGLSS